MSKNKSVTTVLKEPVSAAIHGLGVLLSVAALITLLIMARGHAWQTFTFALYGSTLVILYTASTLYHSLKAGPATSYLLMRFDHCAIFLLIAGTYTPICLVGLRGEWGWNIFCTEWILAAIGITATIAWRTAPDWLRIALYIVMGWIIVFAFPLLRAEITAHGIDWLVAGGLFYTLGTVILATNRPHLWPGRFTAHDLWHVFVVGGSVCHFILMATIITKIPV